MATKRVYRVECDSERCGNSATPADSKEQARVNARAEKYTTVPYIQAKGPSKRRDRCPECVERIGAELAARLAEHVPPVRDRF